MGFFDKLKERVNKTRENFSAKVNQVIKNFRKVDEEFFEELEEALILSDIGYATTEKVIETLRDQVKESKISDSSEIKDMLVKILADYMSAQPLEIKKPTVMLIVGVNGVGKTTAIGKLTNYYNAQGKKVLLAAADTFRAAAAEQLSIWGQRTNTRVIKYAEGADPAAVVYDAIDAAKAADSDLLIIDTAGRLHNKKNLMSELEKINRVIDKEYPGANRETFLVVDATTGQNAISQTEVFNESVKLTGIILTKLDGTAKGGVVCAVKDMTGVPVRFIGVGEGVDDLQPFDAYEFAKAILE
ncbi:signal recognition particle-docking protein FtsY [Christensenella tenuis]|uniref:Signal recognition particle receptor FtsY n=1 Tax=Christensenella tenuis TaxID=2763033 RepID=A0ABR7EBH3_9FIRM|nr:signal recognition particle-docking protein FtsY [Christensenella tenuis]MBC5647112.1 signal recognition particle-docking protein FtsY [Christensenella tenuis]